MADQHIHGTVARREDGTDWSGRKVVRLDLRDVHRRDLHVYVAAGHPLAQLAEGDRLAFVHTG